MTTPELNEERRRAFPPDRGSWRSIPCVRERAGRTAGLTTTQLRDSSTEPGVQPSCTVTVERDGVEQAVPPCPADGACFELVADATACTGTSDHLPIVIQRSVAPCELDHPRALRGSVSRAWPEIRSLIERTSER